MVHNVAVRCGNVAWATGFGVPEIEHGEHHSVGFGERNSLRTKAGTGREVISRMGGTRTSLGSYRAD